MADTGLAHDHVRLAGTGVLARIPKQSQMGLPAQANLEHQAACFRRASAGGRAPRLVGVLPPSVGLPRGALLVEEITGHAARLPQDLPAIMEALAALHRLPMPAPEQRAPLTHAPDSLRALAAEIDAQAAVGAAVELPAPVGQVLDRELARLRALCNRADRPPRCLIAFDAHPGNFLVRPDGAAVLVDLEKCRYSHPGLDIAHATLYTSTTWDRNSQAVLTPDQVAAAYAAWGRAAGPEVAQASRGWHVPLRRAMWLWSVTWCVKWRALSGRAALPAADGEDWSAERSDPALVAHVRERVSHYLDAGVVQRMGAEFDALEAVVG